MPEFDHHSTAFAENWRDQYRQLREASPVTRATGHGGFVVLTRYEDIRHVLHSSKDFVCSRDLAIDGVAEAVPGGVTIPTNPFRMGMMEMDPPQSLALRRILVPWFSSKAVEVNAVHIRDLATWCIDRVIESGHIDIVDDLANPLPTLVTLDLLGLPLENWKHYAAILHGAAYLEAGSAKSLSWLRADIRAIIAERKASPPAVRTPIDALLGAEVDGQPLPDDLVLELVYMLLSGGVDTSTSLIAHCIRLLSSQPAVADELRADPTLIPNAVEEMVRYFSPGTGVARTAVRDTDIGGVPIKAGDRLLLALGSANLDPAEFADPESLDIHRDSARQLSFGAGVHRCLGSVLAPREVSILVEEILRRLPDLRVDESGVRPYETIPLVAGFRAMPATFTPGRKVGHISTDGLPPARSQRELLRTAELAAEDDTDASDTLEAGR
jgi:cytochrome P450